MSELLPCPFCGNSTNIAMANEKHDHSGGYFIACPECDASTGLRYACGDDPRPLLIEQWNRRASQPTAEVVEALQELTHLLERACVYVEQDAQMMADISRHSPLDTDSQAAHDGTVYDSERLRDEIPESLARARAALSQEVPQEPVAEVCERMNENNEWESFAVWEDGVDPPPRGTKLYTAPQVKVAAQEPPPRDPQQEVDLLLGRAAAPSGELPPQSRWRGSSHASARLAAAR